MKFFKLIILAILLHSCHTAKNSLIECNESFLMCKDKICTKEIVYDEIDFQVHYSKIVVKKGQIEVKGIVKDVQNNDGVPYCFIYLGRKVTEDTIFLQREITITNEKDGSFGFNIEFKERDLIIFNALGYRPKIYQIKR